MFRELASDLWVIDQPLRFLGIEIGARTTMIRLRDGSLFVHSPGRLDAALIGELNARGPVHFVIAPNRFHHLFVADYQRAFAGAGFYCAPGLEVKRRDLKFKAILSDVAPADWRGQIEQVVFHTFGALNEVVFFHRASGTLIFTDLMFNLTRSASMLGRIVLKLDGAFGAPAVPRSFRTMLKWHRAATRVLVDRVLGWDFERVVLAHGEVIECDGKRIVDEAWDFV